MIEAIASAIASASATGQRQAHRRRRRRRSSIGRRRPARSRGRRRARTIMTRRASAPGPGTGPSAARTSIGGRCAPVVRGHDPEHLRRGHAPPHARVVHVDHRDVRRRGFVSEEHPLPPADGLPGAHRDRRPRSCALPRPPLRYRTHHYARAAVRISSSANHHRLADRVDRNGERARALLQVQRPDAPGRRRQPLARAEQGREISDRDRSTAPRGDAGKRGARRG